MTGRVSVTRFKANPSRHLARVRAGHSILLTERGRPVARLDPLSSNDDPEAVVASLVAAGLARPPAAPLPDGFFTAPLVADPEGRVLAALLAARGSGPPGGGV